MVNENISSRTRGKGMNRYYSNQVALGERLPLYRVARRLGYSESEVVRSSNNRMYYQLPHSIMRGYN